MIPTNYIVQATILHPFTRGSVWNVTIRYFYSLTPIGYTPAHPAAMAQAVAEWWMQGPGSLQRDSDSNTPPALTVNCWWIDGTPVSSFGSSTTLQTLGVNLPSTQSVVIRMVHKYAGPSQPQVFGRIYVPSINPSDVVGDYLTPTARAAWQVAANHLLTPVSFLTHTMYPCIPSIKWGHFYNADVAIVNQKLGHIVRRPLSNGHTIPFTWFVGMPGFWP